MLVSFNYEEYNFHINEIVRPNTTLWYRNNKIGYKYLYFSFDYMVNVFKKPSWDI